MAETRACSRCGKAFAAVMVKCPFCGAAHTAPAPQAARPAIDFAGLAEQAIAGHRIILELEYHPAAMLALDALLDQTFGPDGAAQAGTAWKPQEGTLKAIAALGAFAGEVLRREWGGAWQLHPQQPEQIFGASLVLPSGVRAYPLSQIYNRAKSGNVQSVRAWFERLRALLNAGEGDVAGWARYAERFAKLGRTDWAGQFYLAAARISRDHSWIDKANALEGDARKAAAQAAQLDEARQAIVSWEAEGEKLLAACGARVDTGCMTLTAVDFLVKEVYGKTNPGEEVRARNRSVERALGAFVGRVLCRRFRAQWQADAGLPAGQWSVAWDAGERAQPFAMIAARIERATASLVLAQVAAAIEGPCARGACVDPPEDPVAWSDQALRFARAQRIDWAIEFGKMALSYGAQEPALRFQLADWLRQAGKFEEASEHVTAGLERDGRNVGGWEICAAVRTALGDERRAQEAAEIARQLRDKPWESPGPKPKPSLESMLAAADELREPGRAVVAYAMINEAYPDYAEAWRERGVGLSLLGRSDAALQCFDRGIALEPKVPRSHDHKAALLGQLKRWDEAFQVIAAGLAQCPGAKTLLQRKAIYLSLTGQKEQALVVFDEVLRLFPGDAHALKLRAEAAAKGSGTA